MGVGVIIKGKGKGLDTCYSATYMSQTRDQQRFAISEVAADWHEPLLACELKILQVTQDRSRPFKITPTRREHVTSYPFRLKYVSILYM